MIEEATEIIVRAEGRPPAGWLGPWISQSSITPDLLAETGYFLALRVGDVFGSWLYKQGGFALSAWITIAVYALIVPTLLFVPKLLIESHDADEKTEEAMVEAAEAEPA